MELLRGHQDHDNCPRCQEEEETTRHVLQCQDPRATETWEMQINKLTEWFNKKDTPADLQFAILRRINQWRKDQTFTEIQGTQLLKDAIQEQDCIGWYNFHLGRISHKFSDIMQQHYSFSESRRSGEVWAKQLINQVWDIAWNMWEHRNYINHHTMTPQEQDKLIQLQQKVRDQFEQGYHSLNALDYHFLENEEKVLELDYSTMYKWLQSITAARESNERSKRLQHSHIA